MLRMNAIKIFLLFAVFVCVLCGRDARAATYTATSCNQTDVQSAINLTSSGDTVIIPNGSCSWSGTINLTQQITLEGASTGCGVVTGEITPTCPLQVTDTNPNPCPSGGAPCATNSVLLNITIGSAARTTIANIAFLPGTGTGAYILISGTGPVPIMHDISFSIPNFQLVQGVQWMVAGGVIWNMNIYSTSNLSALCNPPSNGPGSGSGSFVVKSPLNWDNASTMGMLDTGGVNNLYVENSTFSYVGQIPDADDNARVVFRHDTWINSTGGVGHGPTSTYGTRQIELYNNTFEWTNSNISADRYFWFRGGTAVITNNSVQALNSACTGGPSFQFIVEDATRSSIHNCCTVYGCFHQPGTGANGVGGSTFQGSISAPPDPFAISDPIYIWNNTGTGQANISQMVGLTDEIGSGCSSGDTTATFFQRNRDYFVDVTSSSSSGAKPGWVPYTYPHPLDTGTASAGTPVPPLGVSAVVNTTP
ncbi:MAG: hypothetical protein WBE97_13580 [Candidatus Acidiferrales bacterium]